MNIIIDVAGETEIEESNIAAIIAIELKNRCFKNISLVSHGEVFQDTIPFSIAKKSEGFDKNSAIVIVGAYSK